jgi:Flp pilus assembly protein TadG
MSRRLTRALQSRRRSLRDERGQALVELALLLPVLLLILFAVLDIGKAYNYWVDETHLASEASRWAAVNKDYTQIPGCGGAGSLAACVKSQADTAQLRSGASVTICVVGGAVVGNPVKATVSYDYGWMGFIKNSLGIGPTSTISTSSTMRQEAAGTSFPTC